MFLDSPDFMRQLREHVQKMQGYTEVAICAAPQTVQKLKDLLTKQTGIKPERPLYMFGSVVLECLEIPEDKVLVVDRAFAQQVYEENTIQRGIRP